MGSGGGGAACCKHDAASGPARSDGDPERKAGGNTTICDADERGSTDDADGSDNDADDVEDRIVALWQAWRRGLGDGGGAEGAGVRRAALGDGRPRLVDLRRFARGETSGNVAGLLSVWMESMGRQGVEMAIFERWFCPGSGMLISGGNWSVRGTVCSMLSSLKGAGMLKYGSVWLR